MVISQIECKTASNFVTRKDHLLEMITRGLCLPAAPGLSQSARDSTNGGVLVGRLDAIPAFLPRDVSGPDRGMLARPEGLEPPAYWFEASRSIQLSYGRTS